MSQPPDSPPPETPGIRAALTPWRPRWHEAPRTGRKQIPGQPRAEGGDSGGQGRLWGRVKCSVAGHGEGCARDLLKTTGCSTCGGVAGEGCVSSAMFLGLLISPPPGPASQARWTQNAGPAASGCRDGGRPQLGATPSPWASSCVPEAAVTHGRGVSSSRSRLLPAQGMQRGQQRRCGEQAGPAPLRPGLPKAPRGQLGDTEPASPLLVPEERGHPGPHPPWRHGPGPEVVRSTGGLGGVRTWDRPRRQRTGPAARAFADLHLGASLLAAPAAPSSLPDPAPSPRPWPDPSPSDLNPSSLLVLPRPLCSQH